ncbi:site-specific integrase [Fusibacter sp. 3D3]|uniref:site-specific integrase n=1 Tax=Fusibacter sp. 3D3 TaxID=1048380 RepID=UPI000853C309|nr:site-specific integrase [Fusibacter sp. 3D3]GAU79206.1 hypothetical protein F3D3_3864 [Fusibacter sp. 3D3]
MRELNVALEDFIYETKTGGYSLKTLKNYKNIPLAFLTWINEVHQVDKVEQITKRHIQEYFEFKLENGLSRTYVTYGP